MARIYAFIPPAIGCGAESGADRGVSSVKSGKHCMLTLLSWTRPVGLIFAPVSVFHFLDAFDLYKPCQASIRVTEMQELDVLQRGAFPRTHGLTETESFSLMEWTSKSFSSLQTPPGYTFQLPTRHGHTFSSTRAFPSVAK